MNGTDFFTNVKPHPARNRTLEREIASLPSPSGSCELVQNCLSSARKMNGQKVSVSVEQHRPIVIKFLTAEGIQPSEILERLETQFGEACLQNSSVLLL